MLLNGSDMKLAVAISSQVVSTSFDARHRSLQVLNALDNVALRDLVSAHFITGMSTYAKPHVFVRCERSASMRPSSSKASSITWRFFACVTCM
jgi:hypothetical protein